jgi:hypothetical protein
MRTELRSQARIEQRAANLVHDGQVESLSHSIWLRAVSFGNLASDSVLAYKFL